jgi:GAF domain-containing protein
MPVPVLWSDAMTDSDTPPRVPASQVRDAQPVAAPREQFDALVPVDQRVAPPDMRHFPAQLCRAAVAVLPIDAAAVSAWLGPEVAVPVGASDDEASTAEQLQFTLGEGPCMQASTTGIPLLAADLESPSGPAWRDWPTYAAEVLRWTPFRAVFCFPLVVAGLTVGSLSLYRRRPGEALLDADLADIDHIVGRVTSALLESEVLTSPVTDPEYGWLDAPPARRRHQVWVAQGITMQETGLNARQALSSLRGNAYAVDRSIDEIGEDIVSGRLSPLGLDLRS